MEKLQLITFDKNRKFIKYGSGLIVTLLLTIFAICGYFIEIPVYQPVKMIQYDHKILMPINRNFKTNEIFKAEGKIFNISLSNYNDRFFQVNSTPENMRILQKETITEGAILNGYRNLFKVIIPFVK